MLTAAMTSTWLRGCCWCRFLSYGRQGRWSQQFAAANGRITHLILWNEVPVAGITLTWSYAPQLHASDS